MVKTPCLDEQKGVWNEEEDDRASTHGSGNWTAFSKRSGQRRSGKSSRERLSSNQKTDSKLKSFTPQEEELVIQLHATIGSRWTIIAQQLPGKTDNDVKFLWNTKLKKRLSAMGIDPVTHKPFSQILADYGNLGAFPKPRTRFASLSRDLKNAVVLKPPEFPDHHLYSQLQAVNLVTEASGGAAEGGAYSQEFNWSDFFLEDAFLGDETGGGAAGIGAGEGGGGGGGAVGSNYGGLEASSCSNSSSFVEAMIGGQEEDEMLSQLPCFYEEPFYY